MIEINLKPTEHVLIGYGSLLSIASMERTLGHKYSGPWHVVRLNGWRRGWDVQMPKSNYNYKESDRVVTPERVLYLNVRKQTDSHINCSLFVVTTEELETFDERESVYYRANVNRDIENVRINGGTAWMYVALEEFLWRRDSRPPEAIIRRTYLDILDTAHAELGAEFQREFDATTDAAPKHLIVNDIPA
jgi:hypothetical protein